MLTTLVVLLGLSANAKRMIAHDIGCFVRFVSEWNRMIAHDIGCFVRFVSEWKRMIAHDIGCFVRFVSEREKNDCSRHWLFC